MTRILTQRDAARLEFAVRKIERMAELNKNRRQPVIQSINGGGFGLSWPTSRKEYPPVDGEADPVDIYLTREDRDKMLWFDASHANGYHSESGERIWWLPADPIVGDTFFLLSTSGADMWVRMTALNHAMIAPLVYSLRDVSSETPAEIPSSFFNTRNAQWERIGLGLYYLTAQPQIVRTLVITYTGVKKSFPISYDDTDGDHVYTPYDPITYPGVPLHPLTWGDFYCWSVVYAENITMYQPYLCVFWSSTDGPYG